MIMREHLKRASHRLFLLGDGVGTHVLPAHYYSPVASRKQLHKLEPDWRHSLRPMPFTWNLHAQLNWIRATARYSDEMPLGRIFEGSETVGGFRYGPIEAQFLYSAVRTLAPSRLLEIGSGSTTWISSHAIQANVAEGRNATQITACDPYTADRVAGLPHVSTRPVGGLQVTDEILELGDGDILFIDSTHTVRTGSELAHLYLEVIPRLAPGVIIHIHDIYLPYLFSPTIYHSMFDWQETTLVAALLTGNDRLEVLACQSALAWDRPDELQAIFPEYRPRRMRDGLVEAEPDEGHFPSSLWLRVAA